MKILVVDDEANIRQLLQYNLQLDGHNVIVAVDGEDGLRKVSEKPDLILLDVTMPRLDGLQTCVKLKANPKTRSIPVFMLTAKSQLMDAEKAFRAGADDYLTKPFDPDKLNDRILFKMNKYKKLKSILHKLDKIRKPKNK